MKKLVIGILAHVDAGKTTLSEGMLYLSGKTRRLGRVDNQDAYLDNFELERARGITIFSKQAILKIGDTQVTLLDTPGHVDFSTEMERTLQVLDYAILVISGADGIQGHTKTLWSLCGIYNIPVFIFINKMDQDGTNCEKLMCELKKQLSDGCIEFGQADTGDTDDFNEQIALCDEKLLEAFLKKGHIETSLISEAIMNRKLFPCLFGAALKLDGVEALMKGIAEYAVTPSFPGKFGARVFKISRDNQGNRLTHMKITGGSLKVRDIIENGSREEKVNQIRIYSGQKFEAVNEVTAGSVCAVAGLSRTKPGECFGEEKALYTPVLEPVLSYQIILPEGCDPRMMVPKLRQIEEEEPELHIVWDEQLREIQVQIMGEVQTEILQSLIQSRFGIQVSFGSGRIIYKETIANTVEGVGHFEPLRHYAEVHLLMEPGERGSGLKFAEDCSDDFLSKSWKSLILTHIKEKVHKGVLTGSAVTDMKITLVSGRAHNKHTEGGDFREATYRAVRQGLKESESILLEPYYTYQLELPGNMVGRAMNDVEIMHGTCRILQARGDMTVLAGSAPVAAMRNYHKDVIAYTKGLGRLFCSFKGYEPCHNTEEVVAMIGYDSERDVENPTGSVFCANGAGFLVNWDKVKDYMHVDSYFQKKIDLSEAAIGNPVASTGREWLEPEEVNRILARAHFANKGKKSVWKGKRLTEESRYIETSYKIKPVEAKKEYLLVDGYNIIFAWPELKELVNDNMDGARSKLLDCLCKYQGARKCEIIAVFDAYRVKGHHEEFTDYENIHLVFTGEAQTADHYIEKFAHDNHGKYAITVATSDNLQQMIICGTGCAVLSADELKEEIRRVNEGIIQVYMEKQTINRNYIGDALATETKQKIKESFQKNQGEKNQGQKNQGSDQVDGSSG